MFNGSIGLTAIDGSAWSLPDESWLRRESEPERLSGAEVPAREIAAARNSVSVITHVFATLIVRPSWIWPSARDQATAAVGREATRDFVLQRYGDGRGG